MDPYQTTPSLHPNLPPLRLVNRRTLEHTGPCPFCGGDTHRSDRFHVWLEPGKERYWCRGCNAKGALRTLLGEHRPVPRVSLRQPRHRQRPEPVPTDAAHYRALYTAVALWAHAELLDPANPEPLAYLQARGLERATIERGVLGVTRRDPVVLAATLGEAHPELIPYAEAAGVLIRDGGELRAHPNLCGCLLVPYMANGEIVDLRTRTYPGKGYRSLAGGYESRGAVHPFGWDDLGDSDTVLLTEGEIKAMLATQAYQRGQLSAPALAHPGLSYLREDWGAALRQRGVTTVILAYDSQPRPLQDGAPILAPEEVWSIRHGQTLVAAGLQVRVLRLPLLHGATKVDIDAFILQHGTPCLQHLIDTAPTLETYQRSLPRSLLKRAKLPTGNSYPTRRARPQRLDGTAQRVRPAPDTPALSLAGARAQIADTVRDHVLVGEGILLLAHPPGTGKGHNTVTGLKAYLQTHETPGQIVWTALRKDQLHDQVGLELIPLHGRNADNCRKLPEAQALARRGYAISETLCARRCPFESYCTYRDQFRQREPHDFFAPQPLLQATTWWKQAAVVILDEFDPARLTHIVALDSADLARIARAATGVHAPLILRWLATLLGSSVDRALTGPLLLAELIQLARSEQQELATTLAAAIAALPPAEDQYMLPGFPRGATLSDFEALPPNYLDLLLHLLSREELAYRAGRAITSRLEVTGGQLWLYLRSEHLIEQLARPEQPKIILDATANTALLQAIFPGTPLRAERPRIDGGATVTQVITRDWAKSTLRGPRRERWFDEVARHIRPGRPTLVVCTLACEAELRAALQARGHGGVVLAHYGALRGSNAYKGFDVILAQVYHPNLDALVREGRALFADDPTPLDERTTVTERPLTDATGATWVVQVPTFVDLRLAALLEQRRESELVQAALRGRPFDHPEAQITMLFGLPLPQLPPTTVCEGAGAAPTSNVSRATAACATLAGAAQELLDGGLRVVGVAELTQATGLSVVTIRKHLPAVAGRLGLRLIQQRRIIPLGQGGQRAYARWVLVRRGRWAPQPEERAVLATAAADTPASIDHARNMIATTRVIHHPRARQAAARWRRLRRSQLLLHKPRQEQGGTRASERSDRAAAPSARGGWIAQTRRRRGRC